MRTFDTHLLWASYTTENKDMFQVTVRKNWIQSSSLLLSLFWKSFRLGTPQKDRFRSMISGQLFKGLKISFLKF